MKSLNSFLMERTGKDARFWLNRSMEATSHPILLSRRLLYNARKYASKNLAKVGYYRYPHRIIFLAGMALGGTTWMKNLLARVPGYYTYHAPIPRDMLHKQDICDSAFRNVPKHGYALFKTHLNPTKKNLDCILRNGVEKILITHRDLRDVVVSRYYREMEFPNPENVEGFVDYRGMSKEDALNDSIERVHNFYVWWIKEWLKIAQEMGDRCHIVRFEDLKKNPKEIFSKVLEFYGIHLSNSKIEKIVEASRGSKTMKENILASRILPWGYSSNFRSGKVGGWKEEFTAANLEKCKTLLGKSLIDLGFEQNLNW